MWQIHAAFRLGDYRTSEVDITPVLGLMAVVTVFMLVLYNS